MDRTPQRLRQGVPAGRTLRPRRRPSVRPTLERLEDRVTPSAVFAPQTTFVVSFEPVSVAVGDFNGDGRSDLAAANIDSKTVSVLLDTTAAGASAPSFAAQVTFAVGGDPISVAAGDFNGDGRPDLAVVRRTANTVSVLLNTTAAGATTPSFAAQVTFAVGAAPQAMAVGDFNGDGRPDLAVANYGGNTVSVLLDTAAPGATAPTFAAQVTFAVGSGPDSIAVGDFNGDGRTDLAVANYTANTVSLLLKTAAGASVPTFAAQATFAVGTNPISVAAADFNGDGRADLVAANFGSNTASVLLNTATAGATAAAFAAQATFAVGSSPYSVAASDFNGDGRPDLAVVNGGSDTVSVLLNTAASGAVPAAFAVQATFAVGVGPFTVAAGDFNGDGRPDLVTASNDNTASVLLDATAPFAATGPAGYVVADFRGYGVQEFTPAGGWRQLTPFEASLLAVNASGYVVADFPGYGVQEYTPTAGWRQLTPVDATLLALNDNGYVVGDFPGYGVQEYQPSVGFRQLTPVQATLLAINDAGYVVGNFPGYGVQEYQPSATFRQLTPVQATLLAINDAGYVVADFAGYGVQEYTPAAGWRQLTTVDAALLTITASGRVVADFRGYGVQEYTPAGTFRQLTPVEASLLAADAADSVFADFPGSGLFDYEAATTFLRLLPVDAALLAVA